MCCLKFKLFSRLTNDKALCWNWNSQLVLLQYWLLTVCQFIPERSLHLDDEVDDSNSRTVPNCSPTERDAAIWSIYRLLNKNVPYSIDLKNFVLSYVIVFEMGADETAEFFENVRSQYWVTRPGSTKRTLSAPLPGDGIRETCSCRINKIPWWFWNNARKTNIHHWAFIIEYSL